MRGLLGCESIPTINQSLKVCFTCFNHIRKLINIRCHALTCFFNRSKTRNLFFSTRFHFRQLFTRLGQFHLNLLELRAAIIINFSGIANLRFSSLRRFICCVSVGFCHCDFRRKGIKTIHLRKSLCSRCFRICRSAKPVPAPQITFKTDQSLTGREMFL